MWVSKYLFLKAEVKYNGDKRLDSLGKTFEVNSTVSQLGAIIELDNRDNIFTPDKGLKIHLDGSRSDDFLGSDYEYWRVNYYMYAYKPLSKKLVAGFRLDATTGFRRAAILHASLYIICGGSRLYATRVKQKFFLNLKCAGTL